LAFASWQPAGKSKFMVLPMSSTTTTAPSARTDRRRARTVSAQERLFIATEPMRSSAVWTKARWVPDAAAAVDAAVWEAIHFGVTDWQTLFDTARYAAVAQRRYELRQRRRPPTWTPAPVDPADRLIEITDAQQRVRHLLSIVPPPSPGVTTWIDRVAGQSCGDRMPSRIKQAGRRWAAQVRSELEAGNAVAEACDEVA
jgi:hypothetical protein